MPHQSLLGVIIAVLLVSTWIVFKVDGHGLDKLCQELLQNQDMNPQAADMDTIRQCIDRLEHKLRSAPNDKTMRPVHKRMHTFLRNANGQYSRRGRVAFKRIKDLHRKDREADEARSGVQTRLTADRHVPEDRGAQVSKSRVSFYLAFMVAVVVGGPIFCVIWHLCALKFCPSWTYHFPGERFGARDESSSTELTEQEEVVVVIPPGKRFIAAEIIKV